MTMKNDDGLGPEVKTNPDGTLTVSKGALSMPAKAKADLIKAATESAAALTELVEKAKAAEEDEEGKDGVEMGKSISAVTDSLTGWINTHKAAKMEPGQPAPGAGTAPVVEDDEDEEKKARKSAEAFEGVSFTGPLAALGDALSKSDDMSEADKSRVSALFSEMKALSGDLEKSKKSQAERILESAVSAMTKRDDQLAKAMLKLAETLTPRAGGEAVPSGQAGSGERVRKSAKRKVDDDDTSWVGKDLNDGNLFEESADEDTSFF